MSRRSIVYVDGFNLYYGVLRGGPHKWLDLEHYFGLVRPHDEIQAIKYFTAEISGKTKGNQRDYFLALSTLPLVEVILGRFKKKQIHCRVKACSMLRRDRMFSSMEEKKTDVNIALHLLDDAYQDKCDIQVLVSGDSDLVSAVTMVRDRFPAKKVVVYVPARNQIRGAATELRFAATSNRTLPLPPLKRAQFPNPVPFGSLLVSKPVDW